VGGAAEIIAPQKDSLVKFVTDLIRDHLIESAREPG